MAIEPFQMILYLISWLSFIKIIQYSLSLVLKRFFGSCSGAIAYPLSILVFTLLTLYSVCAGLPCWVAIIPFILTIGYYFINDELSMKDLKQDLVFDAVFLVFFLFALEFRYLNPVISNFSEQFMDHAFLASIMRMPMIPPPDPWFSGGDLCMYYYGGHWTFAMLSLLSNVPSVVSFNLILPTVFGLSAVCLSMTGRMFLNRFTWTPLVALILIHPAILWYIISGESIWTALNSTRWIITGCITEYPVFSLLLGDSHTHVLGLFNQFFLLLMLLILFIHWAKFDIEKRIAGAVITAVSLGFMVVCNSWDFIAYFPLVALTGVFFAIQTRGDPLWSRLFFLLATPALALIIWFPFLLNMSTGSCTGIRWVSAGVDPIQILLYAGIFIGFILIIFKEEIRKAPYLLIIPILLIATGYSATAIVSMPLLCLVGYLVRSSEKKAGMVFPVLLGGVGFSLMCFFSVFQISLDSDSTPLNTIFKLGYAAWMMLSVALLLLTGQYLERFTPPFHPGFKKVMVLVCLLCLLTAPFLVRVDLARDLVGLSFSGGYQTLDGSAYLACDHGDDYQAFQYARSLPAGSTILEGLGGDYSYSAPISSFSGVPTVLGKFSHEFQWRGSRYGWMPERSDDIKIMYENPDLSLSLLKKYQVTHVYVGNTEENMYNISLPLGNFQPVWAGETSTLYRVMNYDEKQEGVWR